MQEKTIISTQENSNKFWYITYAVGVLVGLVAGVIISFAKGWSLTTPATGDTLKICSLCGFFLALIISLAMSRCKLTVTDKRIYGRAVFGKRVDLPLDSISAVGIGLLNSITVATSSGRISFFAIKNRDEIHAVISELLVDRQSKPVSNTTIKQEIPQSNADELRKYKDLLDSGVISQEEFDAKKKQLLGL
jgi:hypothetical protein